MRTNIPVPRQSYQNRSHLVHKDIYWGIERDPGAGGHGQEAEPHAHVEPFTDAGTVQQLRLLCRLGGVLRRLLRRLGAATWRLGGRSAGGHGTGRPSQRAGREARVSSPRVVTQEATATKQLARKDLSQPPPVLPKLTLRSVVPQKFCSSSHNKLPRDRQRDRPLLFSPSTPVASACTPLGHQGSLFQRWLPGSRRLHRLGVLRPPGGHYPTSLLCGSGEPLQPDVSPISPELEPANCWFDTEPMVVG